MYESRFPLEVKVDDTASVRLLAFTGFVVPREGPSSSFTTQQSASSSKLKSVASEPLSCAVARSFCSFTRHPGTKAPFCAGAVERSFDTERALALELSLAVPVLSGRELLERDCKRIGDALGV